ncbi:LysR substrate-binding domain-containing protein [Pedomonas mirosovicensis]|uniref:LysR substrate-binding domain-containing protein n=1 Tax=Pedomonas mirosovicensis TaxID=2908641 RepID=UPI002167F4E3|nr:LysR substrate-binding domain-containing protein [Pedomonas mirosovicensis]MCH8685958.1 LysR substrate-binding domain-containing protein [Pedomonas mirosovicensis]
MQDLNDLYFFAQVVEHEGFAAASRATGVPKSKLSRRIALLEERLGVRLLHRSTRRFSVTEIGRLYYRHCLAMVSEAQAAQEAVDRVQTEPRGTVRLSCPVMLARGALATMVSRFMADHPRVRVHVEVTNRRVDVIEEGLDLAIRVRQPPIEESELIIKKLAPAKSLLVASPALLDRLGRPERPEDLARFDSLDMVRSTGEHAWLMTGQDSRVCKTPFQPRLVSDEMMMLRQAALDGLGVVLLPDWMIGDDVARGDLEPILPDWKHPEGLVHAVFPTRRGLVPAVRLFLDALGTAFEAQHLAEIAPQQG